MLHFPIHVRTYLEYLIFQEFEVNRFKKLVLARDEMTCAIKEIVKGVKNGELSVDDINEYLFSKCLYTHQSKDPDLLIRTSGEVRFSDFLLWQVNFRAFAIVFFSFDELNFITLMTN